jgi:tRNA threonylcarbamoyladenosine biosynthesis protein TsaB
MRIVAIETSGKAGEVALAEDREILAQGLLDPRQRHTQLLVPTIRDLLAQVGWRAKDVQLIAISIGPGSYTGLRVGLTCAKTLAYATGAEVAAVNTLEAIACNPPPDALRVSVISDAQRQEVYRAKFGRPQAGAELKVTQATAIVPVEQWAAALAPESVVLGPGLRRFRDLVPQTITVAPDSLWDPRAAAIAKLGYAQYLAGRRDDYLQLQPLYFRKSAAEEKWDARHGPSRDPSTPTAGG